MKALKGFRFLSFFLFTTSLWGQNSSLSFDGTTQSVSIPSTIYSNGVQNFTIECWVKPSSAATTGTTYHGFVGYPHYLKDLRGAPVNKLSLLETIAKKTGPVTVIARGTVFDMTEEDFQKGAKELLWMTSTLSAVYSKKPERIFFPKAGDY
jgi:hypothetical protein